MSAKQDRQGVRTPADIERKYDLSGKEYAEIRTIATNAQKGADKANKDISEHNTSEFSHADIRKTVADNTSRIVRLESTTPGGGGTSFTTDETLTLRDGVLSVNRATSAEADNTLPITSAAVFTEIGNIDALLQTI